MTEALIGLLLSTIILAGAGGLLHAEWDRVRCSYLTFEAAHASLIGLEPPHDSRIRSWQDPAGVSAEGRCPGASERVSFKWLDGDPRDREDANQASGTD